MVDKVFDKLTTDITYSLVLNSNDRISGTHNNPTFNVEWDNFLPQGITDYKVCYTFQSTCGFYCDSFYQKNPLTPTVGVTESSTFSMVQYPNLIGANLLIFGNGTDVTPGNIVYGVGVPINSTITGIQSQSAVNAYISSPLTANIKEVSSLQIVQQSSVNAVGFSSARILANFGSKSYSYDTSIKGQSVNLGIVSRDTQSLNSKSNSFNAFYCQNCPRTTRRPRNNVFSMSIMNNSLFQGGITAYNADNSVSSYSTTPSTNNYLCDTVNMSSGGRIAGGMLNDMTPWTIVMEFIPLYNPPS